MRLPTACCRWPQTKSPSSTTIPIFPSAVSCRSPCVADDRRGERADRHEQRRVFMKARACGCAEQPCGCCEGVQALTPASECNRPGLAAITYRVGTHGQFLETMKARLSTMVVDGVGADGQTVEQFRPLQGLTTREASDFSIALLDGWAAVGDVLSFYQEHIANEGYLGTATERRSILELSKLVGYTLRPGVASTVYLAYTIDEKQSDPVTIPAGARSQSVPGPGELQQSFETSDPLEA